MAESPRNRAWRIRREMQLRSMGIHRVRRLSLVSGRVEAVWCGMDAPCACQLPMRAVRPVAGGV